MDKVMKGFQIINNALKTGKFTKEELEYIGHFCDSIKGATEKVLKRAEEKENKENEQNA